MSPDRSIAAQQIARAEATMTAWSVAALLLVLLVLTIGGPS
jgi:hypothetical protein